MRNPLLQMDPMLKKKKKFLFHVQEVSSELNNEAAMVVKRPRGNFPGWRHFLL